MIKKFYICFIEAIFMMIICILYTYLFGRDNMIIGLFLGLVSISFLNRDFNREIIHRMVTFLIINLYLTIVSYLSCLNIYTGIIFNFIAIFTVTYGYTTGFKSPTSYMFLMIYIIMASNKIPIEKLTTRLIAVSLGVLIIIIVQVVFNKKKFKNKSIDIIKDITKNLKKQIDNILTETYDEKLSIKINEKIRLLIIYAKEKSSKYFKNNKKDIILFDIAICLSMLNVIINDIEYNKTGANYKQYLKDLKNQINNIERFNMGINNIKKINLDINKFSKIYAQQNNKIIKEGIYILKIFKDIINNEQKRSNISLREIYIYINFPKIREIIDYIKSVSFKSMRGRYSLRLGISISILMYLISTLQLKHSQWIVLSCYVVLQPYQEAGILKAKQRIVGVIIGVAIFFSVFSLIEGYNYALISLFIGFIGYFFFENYAQKVIMTTIISLSSSSLVENIQIISISRLVFVIGGVIIGLIFNKYLLPYKKEDIIIETKKFYKENTKEILKESAKADFDKNNILKLINLFMYRSEIENMLILNSDDKNDIEEIIYKQNVMMSDCRYLILKYLYKNL